MNKNELIIIGLLLLILGIGIYISFQIIYNKGDCVMNPANYMYKQLNQPDYSCGCFPNSAIKQTIDIDFDRIQP